MSPLTRQQVNSMGTKQQTLEGFLREAIARGDLKPGTRLKQQELARQFGVSPTPVRETLRRLEGDGLVLYMPNRGISVARVDFPEVKEIYVMRMVLEGLAVENALASEADLQALHRLQERMDRATTQNRLKTVRNLNYDFHMMIYRLSGYKRLLQFIQALWGLTPWDTVQVIPGRARASMREHHGILEAFRTRNKSQAASRMRTHISHSFAALKTYLSGKTRRSRLGRAHTKNRK